MNFYKHSMDHASELLCKSRLHLGNAHELGFPIAIPLRAIARIACFRLRHFIARNCAINVNNETIKYLLNCAELRGIALN